MNNVKVKEIIEKEAKILKEELTKTESEETYFTDKDLNEIELTQKTYTIQELQNSFINGKSYLKKEDNMEPYLKKEDITILDKDTEGLYFILLPNSEKITEKELTVDNKIYKNKSKHDDLVNLKEKAKKCEDRQILYIGKAKKLKKRLSQYMRKSTNHSGGRAIWRIIEAEKLLVCWANLKDEKHNSEYFEKKLLRSFKLKNDNTLPFANRRI